MQATPHKRVNSELLRLERKVNVHAEEHAEEKRHAVAVTNLVLKKESLRNADHADVAKDQ